MRLRSLLSAFGLTALALIALPAPAQTPPAAAPAATGPALTPPTVGVVEMQRVLLESTAGKSVQTQLETERKKIRDQLAKLGDDIKNGENELKRQRTILSQDAFNEQAQALQRKYNDAQRLEQDRQEAFQKAQNDAFSVIVDNTRDIVQQIAAERRIGLILQKQAVIYLADKNMDLTDDVIQRLNTKLSTVPVNVPAPGQAQAAAGPTAPAVNAPAAPAPAPAPAKSSKK